jgi:hypothetical protein
MTTQLKPQNSVTFKDEVVSADFGDERFNARLGRIVEELGANPNLSIPAATSRAARRWRCCSLFWRSATNEAAFC